MTTLAVWRSHLLASSQPFCRIDFSTAQDLRQILAKRNVDGIVVIAGADGIHSVGVLLAVLASQSVDRPLIIDLRPDFIAYEQVAALFLTGLDTRLAMHSCGPSALGSQITKLGEMQAAPNATDFMIGQLMPLVPVSLRPILIPALVIGGQKSTAPHLEAACMVGGRVIRRTLSDHSLPSPGKILGHIAGCHVAFNTRVLGIPLCDVARSGGFGTVDALRLYLKTRTGIAPRTWKRLGVLDALALLKDRFGLNGASQAPESPDVSPKSRC